MNRFRFLLLLLPILAVFPAFAQLPPIIDREVFFGDPEISGSQLSPDGKYITFLKPFHNIRNIWIKARTEPFENARPLTADSARPIFGYFWSVDSRYVLFVQDKGGDENFRVYAVDPAAQGDPVPPARDLTPMEKVRAMIYDVPKATPNEIIVGLNDRNPQLHDVYRLNLATGERTLLRINEDNVAGWATDLKGNLRLGVRQTPNGGTEILSIEAASLKSVYSVSPEEEVQELRFLPDGNRFYLVTSKGKRLDKSELQVLDLKTGKTQTVDRDPKNEVDFGGAIFSEVNNDLLATYYVGDRIRIYPKQKQFAGDYAALKKALPEGELGLLSMTADENTWLVSVSRDVDPGSVYVFDRRTGKADLLYRSRPNLPSEDLASMQPVRYKSRDGITIPAYLTTPKGVPGKNLPAILLVHGGPWGRDGWGYNSTAQFLANRGYAVLQPNFRGSTGYGKKFLNAGNKQWGTGGMQNDVSDGVRYLIKNGVANPKLIGICGGSYGGYATLAGLAFTPNLYRAGFDICGPSNIVTLLNSIPPYWAPIKKIFAVRVGDLENAKEKKMLEAQSPLNSATKITAPLYVVQGANDPRVKKAEADQIVAALHDLGRDVEYMVAPDEGHGFAGKENRIAMYTAMERFFSKHLGGRVQESVTPEIQNKLNAITVDVKTVTMPKRPSTAGPTSMPVFDGTKVRPSTNSYTTKMAMMGQVIDLTSTRTVSQAEQKGTPTWRIIEISSGPMGSISDTLDVNAASMLPIHRSGAQGPATFTMTFTADSVTGMISGGGMQMPINVRLTSPALLEGAGMELALGTLPLAEGYEAAIPTLDVMKGTTGTNLLKVLGTESVTAAGGTFDSFKITLTPQDDPTAGSTIWIDRADRKTLKVETKLPAQMGGGTAVTEITK